MEFDTSLSLELVVTILAILAAVWRMEGRFDKKLADLRQEQKGDITKMRTDLKSFRTELKADNAELRQEFKADITALRQELKADHAELRTELKVDIAALRQEFKADHAELRTELKGDIVEIRSDLRRIESKVDVCNQRVARLEGIILAREDMVDTIADSPQ